MLTKPGRDDAALAVDHLVTGPRGDRADLGDDAALERDLTRPARPSKNLSSDHTLSYRALRTAVN